MPELPEVETVVRSLRPHLVGQSIESIRVLFPPLLRDARPSELRELRDHPIVSLRRRGKLILLEVESGFVLLFHLKMTGRLFLSPRNIPLRKHTRLAMALRNGQELRFEDPRKFGFVRLLSPGQTDEAVELKTLGPEPLGLDFQTFCRLLGGRRGRLKSLLLNQKFLAGIGNIYADEICFQARLHPARDVLLLGPGERKKLWAAVQAVLEQAIAARGTSIRDFRDGEGREGGFQNYLRVYGREGEPCWLCGARIQKIRLAGRSSHFCPRCQRRGR